MVNQLQHKTAEKFGKIHGLVKFTFMYSKYGFPFTVLFMSYAENFKKALDIVECILPTSSMLKVFVFLEEK